MKRTLISLFWAGIFLLITVSPGFAQSPSASGMSQKKDIVKSEGTPAAPGTYQFIVIPTEKGDPFTNDYLVMIENYRDEDQDKILPLTQTTNVLIPSKFSIQQAGFKPLQEIVYRQTNKPTRQ
jgi:hypothetical protein